MRFPRRCPRQINHHEDGERYGHVVDIELGRVPSWWLDIVPYFSTLAFAIFCRQGTSWVELCIFQSLLRGGGSWYDEAGIESVEGVQLAEESEGHVVSYATSSCLGTSSTYGVRVKVWGYGNTRG